MRLLDARTAANEIFKTAWLHADHVADLAEMHTRFGALHIGKFMHFFYDGLRGYCACGLVVH